jgi:hypothetical protein
VIEIEETQENENDENDEVLILLDTEENILQEQSFLRDQLEVLLDEKENQKPEEVDTDPDDDGLETNEEKKF